MSKSLRSGLAVNALAAAALASTPAAPADLYGSIKDGPIVEQRGAGHCYIRKDVGYVWNEGAQSTFGALPHNQVTNEDVEDGWLFEAGVGCGSERGFRGELVFGYRTERELMGTPPLPPVPDDPIHASITSYTAMVNAYYDIGHWDALIPYVGVGVGLAYNDIENVTFTNSPITATIGGNEDLALAWSLMAGVGYKFSRNVTLDAGYRYMDLGNASSDRGDSSLAWSPKLDIDDLSAHEAKVGIRYSFGNLF